MKGSERLSKKRRKTVREIATSFHVNVCEISRLFRFGRVMADKTFDKARAIDIDELRENYMDYNKVRLSSVLRVLGITDEELWRKIPAERETE